MDFESVRVRIFRRAIPPCSSGAPEEEVDPDVDGLVAAVLEHDAHAREALEERVQVPLGRRQRRLALRVEPTYPGRETVLRELQGVLRALLF